MAIFSLCLHMVLPLWVPIMSVNSFLFYSVISPLIEFCPWYWRRLRKREKHKFITFFKFEEFLEMPWFNFSFFNFLKLFIVVQVQMSPFPPHHSPHPSYPYFPPLILTPFGFVYVYFIHVPDNPSPFPPIIPSHLPSGYCQFVLNFNVSGYVLLACLSCWLSSTYRWDHMVFVFHHLAYFT